MTNTRTTSASWTTDIQADRPKSPSLATTDDPRVKPQGARQISAVVWFFFKQKEKDLLLSELFLEPSTVLVCQPGPNKLANDIRSA